MSVLEHHWGSKFPTGINKPLHLSRGVGSHFLVHVHINILSTVVIKPNLFLLASSMWCTNAPNNGNNIEIFNDNNVTFSQLLIYFSLLIKGVSPSLSTLLCCLLRLTDLFIFFALCAGGRRQVLSAAECCWVLLGVWAPETKSNIPAILWWTLVLQGVRVGVFIRISLAEEELRGWVSASGDVPALGRLW